MKNRSPLLVLAQIFAVLLAFAVVGYFVLPGHPPDSCSTWRKATFPYGRRRHAVRNKAP